MIGLIVEDGRSLVSNKIYLAALLKLVLIFLSLPATSDVKQAQDDWSSWTQWGGEYIYGETGYETILEAVASCQRKRISCRLGGFLGEEIKYHDSRGVWNHCISYRTYVVNGVDLPETETSEYACRECEDKELISNDECKIIKKCRSGFVFNELSGLCEAYCENGSSWDPIASVCDDVQEEKTCKTRTGNPIDLFDGKKYRSELVIGLGDKNKTELLYFYNNSLNAEKTASGIRILSSVTPKYLAATAHPVTASEYEMKFTNEGILKDSSTHMPSQFYGDTKQYWRHNFSDVLQIVGNVYTLHVSDGEEVKFFGLGSSETHPRLHLIALATGEEPFSGYRLVDSRSSTAKLFDENGQLRKIVTSPDQEITLVYDVQNRLQRISDGQGAFLSFEYEAMATDSAYSVSQSTHSFPIRVTSNASESVRLEWGHVYQGQTAQFPLLTFMSKPSMGEPTAGRSFEYNDSRWPASLTDIYEVTDIATDESELYAHFEYDEQGRAASSGLADGFEAERVTYLDDYTRIVTNALGKTATYQFADIDGVRRLQRVTGEPTQNCMQSEVEYVYSAAGNIEREIKNGVTTSYRYDSQNREISRTEAAGTPEARTITTEYHPTLNKPVKITEPGKITTMTYDAEGRLLSNTTQSTAAP